jgi:hypothetical protein
MKDIKDPPRKHGGRCGFLSTSHTWTLVWVSKQDQMHVCQSCGSHYYQKKDMLCPEPGTTESGHYWDAEKSRAVTRETPSEQVA